MLDIIREALVSPDVTFEDLEKMISQASPPYSEEDLTITQEEIGEALKHPNSQNQYEKIKYFYENLNLPKTLIEFAVRHDWAFGVMRELEENPSLVSLALIEGYSGKGKPKLIASLLQFAYKHGYNNVIPVLLNAGFDMELYDHNGSTIFHTIAIWPRTDAATFDMIFAKATPALLTQKNAEDYTPLELAREFNHESFLEKSKAMGLEPPEDKSTSEEKAILSGFRGVLPKLLPEQMQHAIDGKELKYGPTIQRAKPVLYTDSEKLLQDLIAKTQASDPKFILNADVILNDRSHAFNLFFIGMDSKHMLCVQIDSMGRDYNNYSVNLESALKEKGIHLQRLVFSTPIQKSDSGCRIITLYIGGRLARLATHQQALDFYKSLQVDGPNATQFYLEDAPLWLGLALICQDMPEIADIDQKGFQDALALGVKKTFCPSFTHIDNPDKNATLERKVKNQKGHAEKSLGPKKK